jgi:uncharacterized membrane protein
MVLVTLGMVRVALGMVLIALGMVWGWFKKDVALVHLWSSYEGIVS